MPPATGDPGFPSFPSTASNTEDTPGRAGRKEERKVEQRAGGAPSVCSGKVGLAPPTPAGCTHLGWYYLGLCGRGHPAGLRWPLCGYFPSLGGQPRGWR